MDLYEIVERENAGNTNLIDTLIFLTVNNRKCTEMTLNCRNYILLSDYYCIEKFIEGQRQRLKNIETNEIKQIILNQTKRNKRVFYSEFYDFARFLAFVVAV